MTEKKLKIGNTAYTELSIQIGSLTAKVDKVLELLLEEQKPHTNSMSIGEDSDIEEFKRILSTSKPFQSSVMTTEDFDQEFK